MSAASDRAATPEQAKNKTIGQVLSQLDGEFPGISASKIRFLEDQGLVQPQRTNTGYRKYSAQDVEQLRFVLQLQRDQYLPLKVIKEKLDSGELWSLREAQPVKRVVEESREETVSASPAAELSVGRGETFTMRELSTASQADLPLLRELITYGLIREVDGVYDEYDVAVASLCSELMAHGIHPRHLRPFRAQADREVALVESAVAPLANRKDAESQARAAQRAGEIAQLCMRLHMALVASSMPTFDE